jgi:hypothetical protein
MSAYSFGCNISAQLLQALPPSGRMTENHRLSRALMKSSLENPGSQLLEYLRHMDWLT